MARSLLTAVLAVGFGASPSIAADFPAAPLPETIIGAAAADWSGVYVGGSLGGAWANASNTFVNNLNFIERFDYDPSSFIGGGFAGYQHQWGVVVLGIEGSFSFADLSQTDPSVALGGGRTRSIDIDQIATVVARLGWTWNNWMFYSKAGWAGAQVTTSSFAPEGFPSNSTKWTSGWALGAGVDHMFNDHWIAGLDFTYVNVDYNRSFSFGDGSSGKITDSEADIYSVQGRVSYKF